MRKLTSLITGAALVVAGLGVGALALPGGAEQSGLRDLAGNTVVPDLPIVDDPTTVRQVGDARLRIPSVDLDVRLGEIRTRNGVLNPPSYDGAYLVRDLGTADGTTFVVMHSLRGGIGPGNAVIDIPGGRVALEPGALIEVGCTTFRLTETHVVAKTELPSRADIWQDVPGRLALMTCLQNARNTPSTANAVIIAEQL